MAEDKHEFNSGAVRSKLDDVRYDLISPQALRRLAATYAEGAEKYGDNNFRKGMEFSNVLNHVLTHIFDYLADEDNHPMYEGIEVEDHLAHACWGLMTLMEQEETKPELNDLYFHNGRDAL
ncbi:hypothetical protein LCGC14_1808530 [marine sediment metagenome]|uniref:dATP/dGTP diphosphohydrolase N-terminal domain-containing protein n=1 Tax=marine sediment metagenome TaxID=412755 RepID=A0A0F9JM38_9ZZZZ